MPNNAPITDKTTLEQLEHLIDAYTCKELLTAVASICDEKAEHVATNWQDIPLAKEWAKLAGQITKLAEKVFL